MAGHSKWAKIKRAKAVNDKKKGAIFTKISHEITQAAKQGDPDPDRNFSLRLAIDKAKEVNMPKQNIERAVEKGVGGSSDNSDDFQLVSYEGIWKEGVVFIVDCLTDNNNRTVSDLKLIIDKNGGTLADPGSVNWQFDNQGEIIVGSGLLTKSDKYGTPDYYQGAELEQLEVSLLEIEGILDYQEIEHPDLGKYDSSINFLRVLTAPAMLHSITQQIAEKKWLITSSELAKIPTQPINQLPSSLEEKWYEFCEKIGEYDDVEAIWDNISE